MAEKKKILYIITKSVWAGASKYVYDLATGLPKNDFEPIVAAGGKNVMAQKITTADLPYFEIKNFQRNVNLLRDVLAFFEILSLLFKTKPNIVHVSSAKAGGITGLASFVYKILKPLVASGYTLTTIFTVHGWTFSESRPRWQIFLIKFFSKLTCLFYNKIICVSEYDYNVAIKNKIAPAKKLTTIHNGIKIDEYKFLEKGEAREYLTPPLNPPLTKGGHGGVEPLLIGTIGEFTKNKGQEWLIEAMSKWKVESGPSTKLGVKKLKVFIIGFGEEISNLKSQISKLNLQDKIFLIENLPNAVEYLKAFDIFVLPSVKEGLPYILLEAGLAELSIIATDVGGVPEIIKNNEAGILVPPANPEALANAIKKLINNPDLRRKLSQNARQKILQNFTFEKMLKKTIGLYRNCFNVSL